MADDSEGRGMRPAKGARHAHAAMRMGALQLCSARYWIFNYQWFVTYGGFRDRSTPQSVTNVRKTKVSSQF